jgi:hypothetical protein
VRFAALVFAVSVVALAGCAAGGFTSPPPSKAPASRAVADGLPFNTPTPDPNHLYIDHDGTFFIYALPLNRRSKPLRTLAEASPGALPPQIAADQFGSIAIGTPTQISIFKPPILSFAPKRARLTIPLTPAITQMGPAGAVLADLEFDPNENLWVLNNYGSGQVSELAAPLSKYAVATASIQFGVAGTKTGPYASVRQARFDVNGGLYVYASQTQGSFSLLFKSSFPYAKPPAGEFGLDLSTPDFVDPTQWVNGPPPALSGGLLLGAYNGLLVAPTPGKSPPPPVQVLAEFNMPIQPIGFSPVVPNASVNDVYSGLIADPNRNVFYSLTTSDGSLKVYALPLSTGAAPILRLPCPARPASACSNKPEHIFFAP